MSARRIYPPFEAAVRRIRCCGRVDEGPEVAVEYLRPIAESGATPGEATAPVGLTAQSWDEAILLVADVWADILRPP